MRFTRFTPRTTPLPFASLLLFTNSISVDALQTRTLESLGLELDKHGDIISTDDASVLEDFLSSSTKVQDSGLFDYGLYEVVDVVSIQAVCDTDRSQCVCEARLLMPSSGTVNSGKCNSCSIAKKEQSNPSFGASVDCSRIDPSHPQCQFQCTVPHLEYHPEQVSLCGLSKCFDAGGGFAASDNETPGGTSSMDNEDKVDILYVDTSNVPANGEDEEDVPFEIVETEDGPLALYNGEKDPHKVLSNEDVLRPKQLGASLSAKMNARLGIDVQEGRRLLGGNDNDGTDGGFPKLLTFLDINSDIKGTGVFDLGHYQLADPNNLLEVNTVCNTNRTTCVCQAKFKGQLCPLCGVQNDEDHNPALGADVDCSRMDKNFPNCAFSCENPDLQDELDAGTCGFNTCLDLTEDVQPEFVPLIQDPEVDFDDDELADVIMEAESGAVDRGTLQQLTAIVVGAATVGSTFLLC